MKQVISALLIAILILMTLPSYGMRSMRCSNQVIAIGDTSGKVQHYCGSPESKQTFIEERISGYSILPEVRQENRVFIEKQKWTYNFGSSDFLYIVTFENGIVERVETNGYGY